MQKADDGRVALNAIRHIVRALRESAAGAERKTGITGSQLFVLKTLARAGVMSVNELAAETFTHQSTVSVVVRKLVAQKLVRKSASARDQRSVELTVSPKGRALLKRAPTSAQGRLIAAVRALPSAERKRLAATLVRLASAVETRRRKPSMFFEDGKPR
jgi:DNA-binding MarR family transcriptional regulator